MQKEVGSNRQMFSGTKVLVMGLGLHGGGAATVKWLFNHGAKVTVTDMRGKKILAPSLLALKGLPIRYVLGKHRMEDFRSNDVIVVNPGVPRESKYLRAAKRAGKKIENDTSIFFRFARNPIIAITGTRGKSTTTLWVAEFLKKKYGDVRPSGNTPDNALLKELDRIDGANRAGKNIPVVAELSSWQLEHLVRSENTPHIAAITNIYPEHLNRYRGIASYARAKANIFKQQRAEDVLILNYDDPWRRFFEKKKPKSALYYICKSVLPKKLNGAYVKNGKIFLRSGKEEQQLFSVVRFRKERGEHNLENLLRAVLAVKLFDPAVRITEHEALALPIPPMRQEIIFKRGKLAVVNDSCATSPDGALAAIERFRKEGSVILLIGGTDKKLEFGSIATEIKKYIPARQLILLEGSATEKLKNALAAVHYENSFYEFSTLNECVLEAFRLARAMKGTRIILFSSGAASFEKFLHEFDRGEKFNRLVKKAATLLRD